MLTSIPCAEQAIASGEILHAIVGGTLVTLANNAALTYLLGNGIREAIAAALQEHMDPIANAINEVVTAARDAYIPPDAPGPGQGADGGGGREDGRGAPKKKQKAQKPKPLSPADRKQVLIFLRERVPLCTSTTAAGKMYEEAVKKSIVYGRPTVSRGMLRGSRTCASTR